MIYKLWFLIMLLMMLMLMRWWWLWWYWDYDFDEIEKRKWWCAHLTLIHSFICFECLIIIICYDATCWNSLRINLHKYKHVFPLKLSVIIHCFLLLWVMCWLLLHLFGLLICMVLSWVSLWCIPVLFYVLILIVLFFLSKVYYNVWDETSVLAISYKFWFKGEHYDQAVFGSLALCFCPLFGTKRLFYFFLYCGHSFTSRLMYS